MNIPDGHDRNQASIDSDELLVPVLPCSGCGRTVLLPFRRFLNSSVVEPYWPATDQRLTWVCDACGHFSQPLRDDLEWVRCGSRSAPAQNRGIWRVEIPCPVPGCTQTVVAHTQTFGQTSRRSLGLMIAGASPTPACAAGHSLSSERSYPARVDFIEWAGADDYLA